MLVRSGAPPHHPSDFILHNSPPCPFSPTTCLRAVALAIPSAWSHVPLEICTTPHFFCCQTPIAIATTLITLVISASCPQLCTPLYSLQSTFMPVVTRDTYTTLREGCVGVKTRGFEQDQFIQRKRTVIQPCLLAPAQESLSHAVGYVCSG